MGVRFKMLTANIPLTKIIKAQKSHRISGGFLM